MARKHSRTKSGTGQTLGGGAAIQDRGVGAVVRACACLRVLVRACYSNSAVMYICLIRFFGCVFARLCVYASVVHVVYVAK
eukprot:5326843-Pleurochrysis_carterae.AAC.1